MLDGLKRIINSAKVQLLAGAAFSAAMLYVFTDGTSAEKRPLLRDLMYAIAALVGFVILGWAHEDAAAKSQPQSQVNVGSRVENAAPLPTPSPVAEPTPKPVEPKRTITTADVLVEQMRELKTMNANMSAFVQHLQLKEPLNPQPTPSAEKSPST